MKHRCHQTRGGAETLPDGDTAPFRLGNHVEHDGLRGSGQCLDVSERFGYSLVVQTAQRGAQVIEAARHRRHGIAHCYGHAPILASTTDSFGFLSCRDEVGGMPHCAGVTCTPRRRTRDTARFPAQ